MTVTAAAIPIVRAAMRRYVGSLRLKIVRYWSSVHVWTICAVKESLVQNEDASIAPSDAAYTAMNAQAGTREEHEELAATAGARRRPRCGGGPPAGGLPRVRRRPPSYVSR